MDITVFGNKEEALILFYDGQNKSNAIPGSPRIIMKSISAPQKAAELLAQAIAAGIGIYKNTLSAVKSTADRMASDIKQIAEGFKQKA